MEEEPPDLKIRELEKVTSKRLTLDRLKQTPYRPLSKLVEIEEITKIRIAYPPLIFSKGLEFCHMLNYPHSNCNGKKYNDGNCFETKTPGCRDGRIYLRLKKLTKKENFSLFVASYLSRTIDFFLPRR
jgi:hypothetical protein